VFRRDRSQPLAGPQVAAEAEQVDPAELKSAGTIGPRESPEDALRSTFADHVHEGARPRAEGADGGPCPTKKCKPEQGPDTRRTRKTGDQARAHTFRLKLACPLDARRWFEHELRNYRHGQVPVRGQQRFIMFSAANDFEGHLGVAFRVAGHGYPLYSAPLKRPVAQNGRDLRMGSDGLRVGPRHEQDLPHVARRNETGEHLVEYAGVRE
jgi:hypothetical protein